jgi:hypothetical protein
MNPCIHAVDAKSLIRRGEADLPQSKNGIPFVPEVDNGVSTKVPVTEYGIG